MFRNKNYISKIGLTSLTMFGIAKFSSKGQVVIPENIRKKLGIDTGSTCLVRTIGNKIILEKEEDVQKKLDFLDKQKEKTAWSALAEKSLEKLWNNKRDELEWEKYL